MADLCDGGPESVNFACNLVQRSEDAKISRPVTFSPHPPLYQLEASCGNLESS